MFLIIFKTKICISFVFVATNRPDWNASKQLLSDINFLKKLQEYDVNHIPEALLKRIKPYVDHKDFDPAVSFYT